MTISGPPEARTRTAWRSSSLFCPMVANGVSSSNGCGPDGWRTNIGNVATLDDAVAAFNPTERISGQTIIRIRR
ncbi:MAG: hypothetical protein Q8K58_02970 [Acidimicrobiales bacterium]|nr:hypothetical protein [Acidimicrobiales bacterium]